MGPWLFGLRQARPLRFAASAPRAQRRVGGLPPMLGKQQDLGHIYPPVWHEMKNADARRTIRLLVTSACRTLLACALRERRIRRSRICESSGTTGPFDLCIGHCRLRCRCPSYKGDVAGGQGTISSLDRAVQTDLAQIVLTGTDPCRRMPDRAIMLTIELQAFAISSGATALVRCLALPHPRGIFAQ